MALKWHGEKVKRDINQAMKQRLDMVGITITKYARERLNQKVNRDGKTPSKPGDSYPAMRTSHLRGSIDYEPEKGLAIRWGTNVIYGRFLQFKNPSSGGRPWMSAANRETKAQVIKILGQKFSGSIGAK